MGWQPSRNEWMYVLFFCLIVSAWPTRLATPAVVASCESQVGVARPPAVTRRASNVGAIAPPQAADSRDVAAVPIEQPTTGIRLYGTASPFASWPHCDLSPDGKWLVGFRGTRMLVWDRQAARVAKEMDVVALGSVQSCKFSPRGKYCAIFVKHWLDLPELSDADEPGEDSEAIDPDKLLDLKPKFRSQVLVFDRQWKQVAAFDVDCHGPQFPDGLLFSQDESALLLNGEIGTFIGWMAVLDLDDHSIHVPTAEWQRFGGAAVWLNAREIAWPRERKTWDWRNDRFTPWPPDFLPDTWSVQSSSADGDWWLVQKQTGKVLYQLSTQREVPLTGWQGYAFGQVSPDGQYFLGVGARHATREVMLLDLDQEQELARVEDWGITEIRFVPNEPVAHLTMFASNAGTRAQSITMAAVPVDDGFTDALNQAQQQLPVTDRIAFAAQDQWLVLAGGRSWVNLSDGQLAGIGPSVRSVLMVAPQPASEHVYTFGTPADRANQWNEMALTRQSRHPDGGKRLTTIQPPTEILRSLRILLGTQTTSYGDWSVYPAHLSVSLDQTQLRTAQWEDKALTADSMVRRLHLNRWEVGRHKKIRSTLLAVSADKPKSARHFQLSPDGSQYAVAHGAGLWLGDAEEGELRRDVRLPGIATGLEFSADNRWLAVALIRAPWQSGGMWPSARNQTLATEIALIEVETSLIRFQKKNLDLVGFGFRPEGQQLYTLQRDGQAGRKRLVLYRPTSWEPEFEHTTDYSEALAAAFSSDGRLLAIPLADTRIEVWDLDALHQAP